VDFFMNLSDLGAAIGQDVWSWVVFVMDVVL
jgi:hypothetical protein